MTENCGSVYVDRHSERGYVCSLPAHYGTSHYNKETGIHWTTNDETGHLTSLMEPLKITDDPVEHPPHYTSHPSGVECIAVTRHFNFNRGNAIKYIWRAGSKGDEIEDLRKSIWYLQDEINRLVDKAEGLE